MAGKLMHTLVVRHPDTLEAVALLEGTTVPDWATDLVDKGNLSTSTRSSIESEGYDDMSSADLKTEAEKRGIEVEGSGANGNVVKADLVAALTAHDNN